MTLPDMQPHEEPVLPPGTDPPVVEEFRIEKDNPGGFLPRAKSKSKRDNHPDKGPNPRRGGVVPQRGSWGI